MFDGFDTYDQLLDYYRNLIRQLPGCLNSRIQIADEPHPKLGTPCWLWTDRLNRNGYGRVRIAGKEPVAHRAVFERVCGPIPDGKILDHGCRVRRCVNPYHTEPVTPRVNTLRGEAVLFKKKSNANPESATVRTDLPSDAGDAGDRSEALRSGEYHPRIRGEEPRLQGHDPKAAPGGRRRKVVGDAVLAYGAVATIFLCFFYALMVLHT